MSMKSYFDTTRFVLLTIDREAKEKGLEISDFHKAGYDNQRTDDVIQYLSENNCIHYSKEKSKIIGLSNSGKGFLYCIEEDDVWEEIKKTSKQFSTPAMGIDCIAILSQIAPQVKKRLGK